MEIKTFYRLRGKIFGRRSPDAQEQLNTAFSQYRDQFTSRHMRVNPTAECANDDLRRKTFEPSLKQNLSNACHK
jgi:hypothetical protein